MRRLEMQLEDERRLRETQEEKLRAMEGTIQALQKQNAKLRRDFRKSIAMLEQMKRRPAADQRKWRVADAEGFAYAPRKTEPRAETPEREQARTRRRVLVRRGSSAEKYRRSVLAESGGRAERGETAQAARKWKLLRRELDECKGLLRAGECGLSRGERRSHEDARSCGSRREGQGGSSEGGGQGSGEMQLGIDPLGNYQYLGHTLSRSAALRLKEKSQAASERIPRDREPGALSENDLEEIFAKKENRVQKVRRRKTPRYDEGLFEYLRQTGDLVIE